MRRRWSAILLVMSTVWVGACSRNFSPQSPCNFVQNSDLQRVSWNNAVPIKLYIHNSVPLQHYPEMESVLSEAVAEWNRVAGRELIRIEAFGVGGDKLPKKDGYSVLYWLNEWEDSARLEQARTTIYWSGAQIYEADIRINAKDHDFYVGHDTSFSGVDFKSLIIHELGHALGLAHNDTPKSVMNASLNSGLDRRAISKVDVDSILCEYAKR